MANDAEETISGHALETYKSMVSIGVESTKAMLLLNGGAVVALLAYIGQADRATEHLAARLTIPVLAFVAGILFAALSFLTGYQTQYTLFNERGTLGERHMAWQKATVGVLIASLMSFAAGAVLTIRALSGPVPAVVDSLKTK